MRSPPRFFVQVFGRAAQVILLRYYQAVRAEKCMEKRGAERTFARRAECKQKKQTEFSLLFEIYTKQKGGSGSCGNGF